MPHQHWAIMFEASTSAVRIVLYFAVVIAVLLVVAVADAVVGVLALDVVLIVLDPCSCSCPSCCS